MKTINLIGNDDFGQRDDSWKEFLPALARHKLAMATVFLFTILTTYCVLEFGFSERYDSTAKLLVKLGRENSDAPETVRNPSIMATGVRQQELESEVQLLMSRMLTETIVDEVGPEAFKSPLVPPKTLLQAVKFHVKKTWRWVKTQYEEALIAANLKKRLSDRDKAILALEESLLVEVEKDSDVITVRVGLPSPDLSTDVAHRLVNHYFDGHIRVRSTDKARAFFDEQMRANAALLAEKEEERRNLRSEMGLRSVPEERSLLLKRADELRSKVADGESQIANLAHQQQAMLDRLQELPDRIQTSQVINPNPVAESLEQKLSGLRVDRAEKLSTQYTPQSHVIQSLDQEIASIEDLRKSTDASLVGAQTVDVNPVRQSILKSYEETQTAISGLQAAVSQNRNGTYRLEADLRKLDSGEDALMAAERERTIAEQNYLTYAKRSEEARINEELDRERVANVVVLSPPSRPIQPAYPPKLLIMEVAAGAALVLAIAMALLLEFMRDTIESPKDIAAVAGVQFLGLVEKTAGETVPVSVVTKEKARMP